MMTINQFYGARSILSNLSFNPAGDFAEDVIKQAHQLGEYEERQTHWLRDRSKAANAHSNGSSWE
jgi:hypothetical protein